MNTAPPKAEMPHHTAAGNRFARHPVATLSAVLTLLLFAIIVAAEVFLKTFTGLGNPLLYETNPLYGYRPLPNQVIKPKGGMGFLYAARVTTNNLGLRATADWDANPAQKILFLGDSVTYGGQYVNDEQLFSSVAGSVLEGWQVGNGGVNAWGVENIVGLVMDYDFSPAEVVVICLIEGDFYRGTTRVASLPVWTTRPDFALRDMFMHNLWRINELARYGSSVDTVTPDAAQQEKIVNRAARHLKGLVSHLQNSGVRSYVFILPTQEQVVGDEPLDSEVQNALAKHQVQAVYLLPELRDLEPDVAKRRAWFHDSVHLEPPGHLAYGTLLSKRLKKQLSPKG